MRYRRTIPPTTIVKVWFIARVHCTGAFHLEATRLHLGGEKQYSWIAHNRTDAHGFDGLATRSGTRQIAAFNLASEGSELRVRIGVLTGGGRGGGGISGVYSFRCDAIKEARGIKTDAAAQMAMATGPECDEQCR